MLKYCEAYRTMRESLCREKSKIEHYSHVENELVRSKVDQRSLVLNTNYVPPSDTTKCCKDNNVHEKQCRRPSVSFDQEFTFTPRLNLTSVRLAKERTTKAYDAIERRTRSLVEESEQNFTFKPKVSSKSEKIVQNLKTSFLERQMIHAEKQRQKLDNIEMTSSTQLTSRLSPVPQFSKLGASKSERLNSNEKMIKLSKSPLTRSAPDCFSATKQENTEMKTKRYSRTTEDSFAKQPCQNKQQFITRYKRLKTCSGTENEEENNGKENENSSKQNTTKHISKNQFENIPLYHKLRQTKIAAENAIKDRKVFVCHGPYPIVRASLRKRGWVEKHFKGCHAVADNKKTTSSDLPGKHGSDEDKTTDSEQNDNKMNEEEDDETMKWKAGYESGECHYTLLSRFCRNAPASFFWTCKRDDIDFKYLRKEQIANHFSKAYSFTTKVGLCCHLKNLSWFEDMHSDTFFPRCRRLGSDEEKEDFIDDYRITTACNILKLLDRFVKNRTSTSSSTLSQSVVLPKSNSTSSMRKSSLTRTNLQAAPLPSDITRDSPRSRSSFAQRRNLDFQEVSRAISLSLRACQEFLMCKNNEDIDKSLNQCMTDQVWDELVEYFYCILHNKQSFEGQQHLVDKCRETLQQMRQYLPQLDLDGVRNVWIVKPGAKSRGRGIMCMDRLQDILKLVSSTVKKENRWIIQKYIESPLLVYNTKFDIRQWFLVTDWNPLTLWFYKDCYIRFCSQEFTLDNFEPCVHLSNNSVQKHYENGVRDKRLPESNMWSSEEFQEYLNEKGKGGAWSEVIYPGMKQAIVYTLECCQTTLEARKNSFELYGADFMLTEDLKPWLIEINSSPAMSASTTVTRKLCANVIEDTMKVVLDRREDKHCETGSFELAFKQPHVDAPPYIGINLAVIGNGILPPISVIRRRWTPSRLQNLLRSKSKKEKKEDSGDEEKGEEVETEGNVEKQLEGREATVLKLKETSLVLDYGENVPSSSKPQHENIVKLKKRTCNEWTSVELLNCTADKKHDATAKTTQIRMLNIDPNILRPVPKKKNFENKFVKSNTNNRVNKVFKKLKMERNDQEDVDGIESKVSSRIISIPDVGVPRTILKYTDKRFRNPSSIETSSQFRLQKDVQVVK